MENINDGGPAFPSHGSMGEVICEGMSLRDWFAGNSLKGYRSNCNEDQNTSSEIIASFCYQDADAMLKAKEV